MPRLPTAETLGERPAPRVTAAPVTYRPAADGTVGLSLVRTGKELEGVGNELYRRAKLEEERINTLRAEEAFNTLRNAQLDLTIGEENGFTRRKGAEAINQPLLKDYSSKWNEVARRIESGLGNDQQKELFRKRADVAGLQFKEGLLRHVGQEADTYAKQVYTATLDTEVRSASAKWNEPNAIALSFERINAAISKEAERAGWDATVVESERLKAESKVHAAVIGQAIASGELAYAQRYYEVNKDGIDPASAKVVQKAVEDGVQKQLSNGYNSAFLAARNDARALSELEKKVASDTTLDEARKNTLLGRIQSRGEVLNLRAERTYDRHLKRVERGINQVNAITLAGFEPTVEQMEPLIAAAKGTELEPEVKRMVQTANVTREFRNMVPAAQEAWLAQAEATARKDPSKFDVTLLSRFRSIHEAQKKQISESPITFAVRQGFADSAPLDLSKPAEIGGPLQQRFDLARQMRSRYQAPFKPLTPQEATLLSGALKGATVAQKREYFASLAQSANGDMEGYSAIMGQLAPDDPVTAIAGAHAGRGRTQAADLILQGQAILNPPRKEDGSPQGGKLWPMPPETDLRSQFAAYERDAFAGLPKARSDHYQAALAIYAAKSAEEGDSTGVINSRRWEESIRLATGGIDRYLGKSIVLPYGMEYGQFKTDLFRRIDAIAGSGVLAEGVTASRLKDMPLASAGDGRYVFRAGDGVLVDKSGRPIIVDFNTTLPVLPQDAPPSAAEIAAAEQPATMRVRQKK